VTLSCQAAPLRQVVRDVVEQAGLDGCQAAPLGGLWFYRGTEPCVSRELLWDRAVVRTYDLESILVRLPMLSGEAVAHRLDVRNQPPPLLDHENTGAFARGRRRKVSVRRMPTTWELNHLSRHGALASCG